MNSKVGIVAFFGFEEIRERFLVPAVEIGPLGAVPVGSGFALELSQPDLLQDVVQGVLLHLEHPDQIAHQQIEVGSKSLETRGKRVKFEFQGVARPICGMTKSRAQCAETRLDGYLVVGGTKAQFY